MVGVGAEEVLEHHSLESCQASVVVVAEGADRQRQADPALEEAEAVAEVPRRT